MVDRIATIENYVEEVEYTCKMIRREIKGIKDDITKAQKKTTSDSKIAKHLATKPVVRKKTPSSSYSGSYPGTSCGSSGMGGC
jgi:hypothetical protein